VIGAANPYNPATNYNGIRARWRLTHARHAFDAFSILSTVDEEKTPIASVSLQFRHYLNLRINDWSWLD
jgi:hypothetical protein